MSDTSGQSPVAGQSDGSTIDLRNVGDTSATSGATTTTGGSGTTPADSAATTPVVDPKVASEFGLDADQLADIAKKYTIPESVKSQFPDLVALLVKTESMNDEERDYWFQVLPIMNEDQIIKLRTILVNEREQLKKIDTEYDSEMKKLNDVHKNEWNAFEEQQKRAVLKQAEASHEEQEQTKEDDLLKRLQDIDNA
ncbi:MAG: hypothetical protein WC101_01350 [Candidatus Gracilibacteria bacterium]|nr:hypothetical protein [Candidatus Gracilibacteria bacterium]